MLGLCVLWFLRSWFLGLLAVHFLCIFLDDAFEVCAAAFNRTFPAEFAILVFLLALGFTGAFRIGGHNILKLLGEDGELQQPCAQG